MVGRRYNRWRGSKPPHLNWVHFLFSLVPGIKPPVSAKAERFIVVSIGDTDGHGYDEKALPLLLALVDAHAPDHRIFTHTGVVAQFRSSKQKLQVVRELVAQVERLRAADPRFVELKIGIAEGELTGNFDRLGRVKAGAMGLLGDANIEAVRGEKISGDYARKLNLIAQGLEAETA